MSIVIDGGPFDNYPAEAAEAATNMQALFRGYLVRKNLQDQQSAAITIQSLWKGCTTRKSMQEHGSLDEGTVDEDTARIAEFFRAYSTRRKLERQQAAAIATGAASGSVLEHNEEASATVIQAAWRGHRTRKELNTQRVADFIETLKTESEYIYQFMQDLQGRITDSAHKKVIGNDTKTSLLRELNKVAFKFRGFNQELLEHVESPPEGNSKEFIQQYRAVVDTIHADLNKLCESAGFKDLRTGLDVILGADWEDDFSEESLKALNFFQQTFVPTGFTRCEIETVTDRLHYLKSTSGRIIPDFTENIAKASPFPSQFRLFTAETLYERINGAELCIPVERKDGETELIVVKGYFANDALNLQCLGGWLGRKRTRVMERMRHTPVPRDFQTKFINQYPVRDMVLNSPSDIETDIADAWEEARALRSKALPNLVKQFALSTIERQIRILSLLLMDDEDTKGYFLFNMTAKESPEYKSILRHHLHFSLQNSLDMREEEIEELRKKLGNMDESGISMEDRILASQMDEETQAKALDKAKASKSKGSESDKADAWLNGLFKVPFNRYAPEPVTKDSSRAEIRDHIEHIRATLDASVHGHEEAKQTLLRIVGQWMSKGDSQGEVIAIQGPPGNGKTTLAKEGIAKALDRPFGFLPLGGVTDSGYLLGHDYTYVGSTWGRIVDILMDAGVMNPVIYIDELDKVSQTERGREIIGVLTHLTDSTQNAEFRDKYFSGINFDLSKALIVFSYNDESLIDPILKDRMITIRTKALKLKDKLVIAKDYLMPKILESVGFAPGDLILEDEDIRYLVQNYTYEAGVRRLKEHLFAIAREINLDRLLDPTYALPVRIDVDMIERCLKEPKVEIKTIAPRPMRGTVNGLFATSAGIGGLTIIQAFKTITDKRFELELTGSQGDVMQESMKTALTVAQNLIPADLRRQIRTEEPFGLHIHAPEGATPKDGPSAGGAITVSIISQLTGVPVKNDVAMTGEIDLTGHITKIGGLHSKLRGAKAAGVTLALCPKDNQRDVDKIRDEDPELFEGGFTVETVDNIYDLLSRTLVDNDIDFQQLC